MSELDDAVLQAAEGWYFAEHEPGPPDDDPSDYYTAGPTAGDWLDRLAAAVIARHNALAAEQAEDDPA